MVEKCAWAPSDRAWCRTEAYKWAPFAFDILEVVNTEKFAGLGFHIDVLSEHFLRCALQGHIDDDHVVDMHVECCKAVGFHGPLGIGMVMGKTRHEIASAEEGGEISASIIVYGLEKAKAERLREDWETWSTDEAVAVVISPYKMSPGMFLFGASKDDKPKGTINRQEGIDLLARLMNGELGLAESRLFYKFTARTEPWPWAKRKQLSSVLRAVSSALPSATWDPDKGEFLLPPMGPQTRPEVGNVHVTLEVNNPSGEITWESAMATKITVDEKELNKDLPVKIEVVTTW